jgi:hypothetical protein
MDSGYIVLIVLGVVILFFGLSTGMDGSPNQSGGGIFGKKKIGNISVISLLVILIGGLMFSKCNSLSFM